MRKMFLILLATLAGATTNATPILDVDFSQNNWDVDLTITTVPTTPADLYIDGALIARDVPDFHVSGVATAAFFLSIGTHTVWMMLDGDRIDGNQGYTITEPRIPYSTQHPVPDSGSTALLLTVGLMGCFKLKQVIS